MNNKKVQDIQVEDVMNKKWIPYVLFALCTLFLHYFGHNIYGKGFPYGDDYAVTKNLKDSIWEEIQNPFEMVANWSSRYLINPLIHFVMHFDYRIWIVIELGVFLSIFILIKKYCINSDRIPHLYILMSLMNTQYYLDFSEVGWRVSTITYMWTALAAIVACISVVITLKGNKMKWYWGMAFVVLALFATNKEELSVMLVIVFTVAIVLSIVNKKNCFVLVCQLGVTLFNLFFHMFTPNNTIRYEKKTVVVARDNTFFDKVIIGVSTTLRRIFFQKSFVFLCFLIVLVMVVWFTSKKLIPRVASIVPLVIRFMTWVPGDLDYMFGTNAKSGPRIVATIILGVIGVLAIFVCFYYLYGKTEKTLWLIVTLGAGFAGRCVVGFANSGWQAYERTYTFLYIVLIAIGAMLAADAWDKLTYRKKQVLFGVIIVMGQLGFVKNVFDTGII